MPTRPSQLWRSNVANELQQDYVGWQGTILSFVHLSADSSVCLLRMSAARQTEPLKRLRLPSMCCPDLLGRSLWRRTCVLLALWVLG